MIVCFVFLRKSVKSMQRPAEPCDSRNTIREMPWQLRGEDLEMRADYVSDSRIQHYEQPLHHSGRLRVDSRWELLYFLSWLTEQN